MEKQILEINVTVGAADHAERRFKSVIAGMPLCTGRGRTPHSAIGDLMRSHPELFAHEEVRQALPNSFVYRNGGWYTADAEPSATLGMNAMNFQELFRIKISLVETKYWPVKLRLLAGLTARSN